MSKKCLVFIVGEGPSDIGWLAREPQYRPEASKKRKPAVTGFIPPLLERIGKEYQLSLAFDGRKLAFLGKADVDAYSDEVNAEEKAFRSLAKKATAASQLAHEFGADGIVFVTDVDRSAGQKRSAREARQRWRKLLEAITKGLDDGPLPYVVGIPSRMIEAWALADNKALEAVADTFSKPPVQSPETLWGKKSDKTSNYPKHVLERAVGRSPSEEVFAEIANEADPQVIADACPMSFQPFLDALRERARACRDAG